MIIHCFLRPKRSPIRAAPAIGIARKRHSSQKPAPRALLTDDIQGKGVAITSGSNNVEAGSHHPNNFLVTR